MSIAIIKEPSGIYPAYNDSFVQFTSDLADNERAEITALPAETFPNTFLIFPDNSGKYTFNIKEIAKTILNVSGFDDVNFFDDAYYKSIGGLYLLQSITIEVFNETTSESVVKEYQFFKSVKQVGEQIFSNEKQLLSNSKNGIDYDLTYFEGFPFSVDLQRVLTGKNIKVKNLNNGLETIDFPSTDNSAFRLNIDRSEGLNWTSDNVLPLIEGLNKLEIYEDDVFCTNLNLKKKKICEGVYLKWFNSDGGYNHFLFERFLIEGRKGKDIYFIDNPDFLNVGELESRIQSVGRNVSDSLRIKATYDEKEADTIKSLFSSPLVQLYTSQFENVKGEFINVEIQGSFSYKSKKGNNVQSLTIILPEVLTQKL